MNHEATISAKAANSRKNYEIPGTGLSVFAFIFLVILATAVFLFWGGPFWSSPRHASHVGRFVVSYLIVIPVAAGLLAFRKEFSFGKLSLTTLSVWCIKMITTATIYQSFARGPVAQYEAISPQATHSMNDLSSNATHETGTLRGTLIHNGNPIAGIVASSMQVSDNNPESTEILITDRHYSQKLLLLTTRSTLRITNKDSALHTAHLRMAERSYFNQPIPSGQASSISLEEPGEYVLGCDTHPEEKLNIVVTETHFAQSTETGAFSIQAPIGNGFIIAYAIVNSQPLRVQIPYQLKKNESKDIQIDFSKPSTTTQ